MDYKDLKLNFFKTNISFVRLQYHHTFLCWKSSLYFWRRPTYIQCLQTKSWLACFLYNLLAVAISHSSQTFPIRQSGRLSTHTKELWEASHATILYLMGASNIKSFLITGKVVFLVFSGSFKALYLPTMFGMNILMRASDKIFFYHGKARQLIYCGPFKALCNVLPWTNECVKYSVLHPVIRRFELGLSRSWASSHTTKPAFCQFCGKNNQISRTSATAGLANLESVKPPDSKRKIPSNTGFRFLNPPFNKYCARPLGGGSGPIGIVVASDSRGPRFESRIT